MCSPHQEPPNSEIVQPSLTFQQQMLTRSPSTRSIKHREDHQRLSGSWISDLSQASCYLLSHSLPAPHSHQSQIPTASLANAKLCIPLIVGLKGAREADASFLTKEPGLAGRHVPLSLYLRPSLITVRPPGSPAIVLEVETASGAETPRRLRVCTCALTRKGPRGDCGVTPLFGEMPSAKSRRES